MKLKVCVLWIFVISVSSCAQSSRKSIFDCIYDTEGIPTIQLVTDWQALFSQKSEEAEDYIPAKLTIPVNGVSTTFEVKVRARGMMRKQACTFPPLKIDFKKKELKKNQLDTSISKLKLVFQCGQGNANYELLLKEKLGYDLYKVIAPKYHLEYKELTTEAIQNGKLNYTLHAMIVEDEHHLEKRTGSMLVTDSLMKSSQLDRTTYLRMSTFEYMIGNTDWTVPNRHNVEMYKSDDYAKIVPVAYDFDYSGLVNAPYASPHPRIPIKSVTDRFFMGTGVTDEEAISMGKYFLEKKPDFDKVIVSQQQLSDSTKQSVVRYFDEFYAICKDETKAKSEFKFKGLK